MIRAPKKKSMQCAAITKALSSLAQMGAKFSSVLRLEAQASKLLRVRKYSSTFQIAEQTFSSLRIGAQAYNLLRNLQRKIIASAVTVSLTFTLSPASFADLHLDKLKERARQALDTTLYDEAVDAFTHLIDKDPDNKSYYLRQRGFANIGLYRFDLAIADFKAAGPPPTPTDEAEASAIPDDSDGSAPDWLKALVLYGAGRKVYRAGNLQQSLAMFDAALALKPNFPECQSNKAAVLNVFGQRMAAEELAMTAVSLRPDSSDCWFDLAVIWNRNGQLDKASAAVDCALSAMNDGSVPQLEKNPQYQLLMKLKAEITEKQQAKLQQKTPIERPYF